MWSNAALFAASYLGLNALQRHQCLPLARLRWGSNKQWSSESSANMSVCGIFGHLMPFISGF
jgi:hypothetical protein